MSIKVGIVGTGVMGEDHARILADGVAGAELVAVHDADPARAGRVAAACGARVCDTPATLIAAVDAVLVASPDATHAGLALACIAAGTPVLCEKPLAATLPECRAIVAAEAEAGRRLVQVGFMRRFDPGYRAMKAALGEGTLGAPLFLHCVHRNRVAPDYITSDLVIANACVHEIDVARFLLGEDFVAATVVSPRPARHAPGRSPQLVILETASGVVVDVEAYLDARYGYEVRAELVCETGTVSLSPHPPLSRRAAGLDGFPVEADWRARFAAAYREQLRAWIRSIETGVPAGSSAWDGYAAALTAETCLAALRTGARARVTLEERPGLYG